MSKSRRRLGYGVFLMCAAAAGFGGGRLLDARKDGRAGGHCDCESVPRVETVRPSKGGMRRTTVQPGTVVGFESVDLYAMVSGYLKTQVVDIGSRIRKGEVLAVIDAPRETKALEEAAALVEESKAQVAQAECANQDDGERARRCGRRGRAG